MSDEADRILYSILAKDKKGRDMGINPIRYKDFSIPYHEILYERLKEAVAVYQEFGIYNTNEYRIGTEWCLCIIYKYGYMTYSHHKRISYTERYIFEENAPNPLKKDYNYESIKDYIEDKSIDDEDKVEYIRNIFKEYSKLFDKRGLWEVYQH